MALPEPVWSDDDVKVAEEIIRNPSSLISSTWSKDLTKLAILRALESFQARLRNGGTYFGAHIVHALAQKSVCFWKWRKYINELFSGPFFSP